MPRPLPVATAALAVTALADRQQRVPEEMAATAVMLVQLFPRVTFSAAVPERPRLTTHLRLQVGAATVADLAASQPAVTASLDQADRAALE
jgi:hypothetical protein